MATNPAAYAEPGFHGAHDTLLCIAGSAYVDSADRRRSSPDDWLKPADAVTALFEDLPEAIANTAVVAQRCAFAAPKRRPILPSLAGESGRRGGGAAGGGAGGAGSAAGESRSRCFDFA